MAEEKQKKRRRAAGDGGLYQRSNGLWVGSVELPDRDGKRRRKEVTSMDYQTAMNKLRKLRRDVEDGMEPVSDRTTVEAWLTEWLTIAKKDVKPTTLGAYRSAVNAQLIPRIGTKKLGKLTPRDVRSLIDGISTDRSTGTALNCYWVLSKALDVAKNDGLININPCERVNPPKALRQSRGTHDLDQVKRLLSYLSEHGDPDLTARWCLALFTGARQAECLGLEWDRVDFNLGLVDYSWTLQWLKLADRYKKLPTDVYPREAFDVDPGFDFRPVWRTACLIPPKTEGSRRVVPMVQPLLLALQQHRQALDTGLVWTREGGKPYRKIDDSNRWHATLEAANVPDLTLHSARHTVATLLQAGGVPEAVRMSIMGHSTAAMARNYAHVDQALTRDALSQLDSMLSLD
ncbi:tyrosine-type recombinase/integrase [Gordonia rubripertincta]|uniref:tyrosine-type recombinase/integrase n=1 Tax=Gordonia rubripertincta TaxID=36822 RepID=UPI0015FD0020|nr:site-specific integrase [Gordonia rubripertincta]QMU19304.1 site-specific integrase [Gordonia rubripertincta]